MSQLPIPNSNNDKNSDRDQDNVVNDDNVSEVRKNSVVCSANVRLPEVSLTDTQRELMDHRLELTRDYPDEDGEGLDEISNSDLFIIMADSAYWQARFRDNWIKTKQGSTDRRRLEIFREEKQEFLLEAAEYKAYADELKELEDIASVNDINKGNKRSNIFDT